MAETTSSTQRWVRARNPREYVCDRCHRCGDTCCNAPLPMYHDGDKALCAECFEVNHGA